MRFNCPNVEDRIHSFTSCRHYPKFKMDIQINIKIYLGH